MPDVKYDPCVYAQPFSNVRGAIIQFFNLPQFHGFTLALEVDTFAHACGLLIRHQNNGYDFIYFNPNFNETFGRVDEIHATLSTGRKSMFGYHADCWNASGICGALVWKDFYRFMYGANDPFSREMLFPYSTKLKKCVYPLKYMEWAYAQVDAALEADDRLQRRKVKRKNKINDLRVAKRAKNPVLPIGLSVLHYVITMRIKLHCMALLRSYV